MWDWIEDHVVEIIVATAVVFVILAALTHFRREANEFRNQCHAREGVVQKVDASRGNTYLCLSPDGRLLDSKYI